MKHTKSGVSDIEFSNASDSENSFLSYESLSRRQLVLYSEITDDTFEKLKQAYDVLIEDSLTDPIHLILGSSGGSLSSTLGIINLILLSTTPVYTYLLGETCSGGALIYLAGHKRFAAKTGLTSLMLHPISWEKEGSHGEQTSLLEYMGAMREKFKLFIESRTTIPSELVGELGSFKTKYFVGDELFTFGIATDELTTSSFWITPKTKNKKKSSKQQALQD